MTLKIAFARMNQETNALSPVLTTLQDFQDTHFLSAEELRKALLPDGIEVMGMFRRAELFGFMEAARSHERDVVPVGLFSAWAVASGPLSRSTFETLLETLADNLRKKGPFDGVYLSLHGAMGVVGVLDPEKEIVQCARSVVKNVPIVVSYDLHANLTKERVSACDGLLSYKTNPHRDHAAIGRRAGEMLIGTLQKRVRPAIAWRSLPMILGGGLTLDFLPPMFSVFHRLRQMERDPNVLATSVNMCHPWNNHPSLGWSTSVVTNRDHSLAERLADELAEMCWERRTELPPTFLSASVAIEKARKARLARALGAVIMADLSDVVTAGAPGENTLLLKALLEEGQGLVSYVPLRDPVSVNECWEKPDGAFVELWVGGKLDPTRGSPLLVKGHIVRKGTFHGFGKMVLLAIGDVRLVLVSGPAIVVKPSFYEQIGLNVFRADVIVVKNFFPFLLFFAKVNRKVLLVKTAGVTDLDAAKEIPFDGPIHPFGVVPHWRETDIRRRT